MNSNSDGNVRSIERALDILMCFKPDQQELSLTEISAQINLARSTTHRLLTTLLNQGFLRKHPDSSRYQLGYNLNYLGYVAQESLSINRISLPFMREIQRKSEETVNLYLLDGTQRICAQQVESNSSLKQSVKVGERFPLWEGASGKCMLAHMEQSHWESMAKQIVPLTVNTVVDSKQFFDELRMIKKHEYATSYGERDTEVSCVAAPIFDNCSQIVGSLTISGPTFRVPKNPEKFIQYVLVGSKSISKQLGYKSAHMQSTIKFEGVENNA